jgi:hypothetical protein
MVWNLEINEETFIYRFVKGVFIVEFYLVKYRDLILNFGPWFLGNIGLCMKPWTPTFDPCKDSISSTSI